MLYSPSVVYTAQIPFIYVPSAGRVHFMMYSFYDAINKLYRQMSENRALQDIEQSLTGAHTKTHGRMHALTLNTDLVQHFSLDPKKCLREKSILTNVRRTTIALFSNSRGV